MSIYRTAYAIAFSLIALITTLDSAQAAKFVGKELEIKGNWRDGIITAKSIRAPNKRYDEDKGRVSGRITAVDRGLRRMRIGPLTIHWSAKTRFEQIKESTLRAGLTVKVSVRRRSDGRLEARSIKTRARIREAIRLRGLVSTEEKLEDRSYLVTILGLQVRVPRKTSKEIDRLIRRPDDRRPEDQFTVTIGDRPLTIGGEYNLEGEDRHDFKLGTPDGDNIERDDIARVNQELQLEFVYPFSDDVSMFLEAKGLDRRDVHIENRNRDLETTTELQRGETWVYINRLFSKYSGLQLGRQNVRERREWWWDEDLDAARLRYTDRHIHGEIGLARELFKVSNKQDEIDPEKEDITRIFAHGAWQWRKRQLLEVFALSQTDSSETHAVGEQLNPEEEDEIDADLDWLGLRARGKVKFKHAGRLLYWLDSAVVKGEETVYDYDDNPLPPPAPPREVGDRVDQDVDGWAFDIGASWSTRLPGRPAFTLGYAVGSGDDDPNDGTDESFHQTGLQDNNGRFHGVNRFRYYGELLRPELSNLRIATAAIGFPFSKRSSVELVYHRYEQVYEQEGLRDTRLKIDPNDPDLIDTDIGEELDLVIGMRKWKHVDLEFIVAAFRAGKAFGVNEDETARYVNAEFTYNF